MNEDVSGPACQHREKHRLGEIVSKFVGTMDAAATPWPHDLATTGIKVEGRRCRATFITRGNGYITGQSIRMQTSVLLVVKSGSLIVETAQCPLPVNAGDSAIIAPGLIRLSEIPASYRGRVEYWAVFFKPDLLMRFIPEGSVFAEVITRVTPAFSECYIQKRFLHRLCATGAGDPTIDIVATFRLLVTGGWATVYMYLKDRRKEFERASIATPRSRMAPPEVLHEEGTASDGTRTWHPPPGPP